jgi:hypothetical protein
VLANRETIGAAIEDGELRVRFARAAARAAGKDGGE